MTAFEIGTIYSSPTAYSLLLTVKKISVVSATSTAKSIFNCKHLYEVFGASETLRNRIFIILMNLVTVRSFQFAYIRSLE